MGRGEGTSKELGILWHLALKAVVRRRHFLLQRGGQNPSPVGMDSEEGP